MPILVILIVFSLSFYVFYKIKYVRSTKPGERNWISSKSGIALGLFVLTFGLNQLYLFQSKVSYIVAIVFILLGGINIWSGIKAYRFYLPFAIKEAEGKN
ncbi:YtpI family protein [Bacillus sp. FJAT-27445]|uniref:YtpI family protein n=1 Tax=Bacillus sp. FJAT-27445 TaxID=1679166 RepID=UPI000743AF5B|nr:YtpI family protein [Bacillus sp. FJAT-27445]